MVCFAIWIRYQITWCHLIITSLPETLPGQRSFILLFFNSNSRDPLSDILPLFNCPSATHLVIYISMNILFKYIVIILLSLHYIIIISININIIIIISIIIFNTIELYAMCQLFMPYMFIYLRRVQSEVNPQHNYIT